MCKAGVPLTRTAAAKFRGEMKRLKPSLLLGLSRLGRSNEC
ncbi:hypothetical protein QY96_02353 [Bacillus thermotolerans]|nr:hypothetical protein QY96_02353 [Bacillus thermotolerans]